MKISVRFTAAGVGGSRLVHTPDKPATRFVRNVSFEAGVRRVYSHFLIF